MELLTNATLFGFKFPDLAKDDIYGMEKRIRVGTSKNEKGLKRTKKNKKGQNGQKWTKRLG